MQNTEQITGPGIGIHLDLPAAQYHAVRLPSNSLLSKLTLSPLQARTAMDHPAPPTPAMIFGSALHTLVLEPNKFEQEYTLAGRCEAIYKSGDNKGSRCNNCGSMSSGGHWYCGQHSKGMTADAGLNILSDEDWTRRTVS